MKIKNLDKLNPFSKYKIVVNDIDKYYGRPKHENMK